MILPKKTKKRLVLHLKRILLDAQVERMHKEATFLEQRGQDNSHHFSWLICEISSKASDLSFVEMQLEWLG